MQNQFENLDENHIDSTVKYYCSPPVQSKGFTILMRKVLEKDRPNILNEIKSIIETDPQILDKQNKKGYTALMIACRNVDTFSSIDIIKLLISMNCNVDIQKNNGFTALMLVVYCVKNNKETVMRLLINTGCNLDLKTSIGATALILASTLLDRKLTVGQMLIDAGCNILINNVSSDYKGSNDLYKVVSKIIKHREIMLSSLKNICCHKLMEHRSNLLKSYLRSMVNRDILKFMEEYGMFKI